MEKTSDTKQTYREMNCIGVLPEVLFPRPKTFSFPVKSWTWPSAFTLDLDLSMRYSKDIDSHLVNFS